MQRSTLLLPKPYRGLFPELEVMIQYSDPVEKEKPADGGDAKVEKKPRKARRPNLVLPADAEVCIVDKTIGVPDTKTIDGVEYRRGEDEVTLKLGYTPSKRKVVKLITPTWIPVGQPEDGEVEKIVGFENDKIDALACDASTVANIVVSKFDDHIPLLFRCPNKRGYLDVSIIPMLASMSLPA